MPNDTPEEFDEDASCPIQDLSSSFSYSTHDANFTYGMSDIDNIFRELGIHWKEAKDIPFRTVVPFTSLLWDLEAKTVSFPQSKKEKYLAAIKDWNICPTHTLEETQKLYGKLLHASLVVPKGQAFLTTLESFQGTFRDHPHMPRSPPRHTPDNLEWWSRLLRQPSIQ